jgi:hypothetical protein
MATLKLSTGELLHVTEDYEKVKSLFIFSKVGIIHLTRKVTLDRGLDFPNEQVEEPISINKQHIMTIS